MQTFFSHIGKYMLMLVHLFKRPEKVSMYWKETVRQMYDIGVGSLNIIAVIATFVGAVTVVQFAYQMKDFDLIPMWFMGIIARESMILELAPTVSALLLAGKVGSNVASELGTMRISEQIDALEIMGVNTKAYLIGPKIIGAIIVMPSLILIASALGIFGGGFAGVFGGFLTWTEYIRGLQDNPNMYILVIMFIKAVAFAFIITSISSYHGYHVKGGALEIGAASTRAVVQSCIVIIIANFLIAFVLL